MASSQLEITGKLAFIGETVTFDSGFSKRELAIETVDGEYSQYITLETVKAKTATLDKFEVGQTVTVGFNLRGRFSDKHQRGFNSLTAWRIDPVAAEGFAEAPAEGTLDEESEALPF
tara:strand:- start:57 stop:407 length:351 start_codon:yes stop_codon:yes gene_type:complete